MDHHESPSPTRRWLRRLIYAAVVVFALVFCFYTIENVRGRNAWHNAVAELEAKGEKVEWKDFLPAPVPDGQNMLKAPMMEEWFVKQGGTHPKWHDGEALRAESERLYGSKPVPVATIRVVTPGKVDPAQRVFDWSDAKLREKLSWAFLLTYHPSMKLGSEVILSRHKPGVVALPEILIQSPSTLGIEELQAQIRDNDMESESASFEILDLGTPGVYRLDYNPTVQLSTAFLSAADYLAHTDPFEADLDLIREAGKRPHCQLVLGPETGLYERVTNISSKISMARLVSCRTSAHLLAGNPDKAFAQLKDCDLVQRIALFQPALLLDHLTYEALSGFGLSTAVTALSEGSWSAEQLATLQEKWSKINYVDQSSQALRNERAFISDWLLRMKTEELSFVLDGRFSGSPAPAYNKWQEPSWYAALSVPKGWRYQNVAKNALLIQPILDGLKETPGDLSKAKSASLSARSDLGVTPYSMLALMQTSYLGKVLEKTTHAQTSAHLAVLACALERHRLDTGALPANLDSLVPKYLARLPGQVVHAQPFHYRLEKDGGCTVWSVGWDLTDDGGDISAFEGFSGRDAEDWGYRLPGRPAK